MRPPSLWGQLVAVNPIPGNRATEMNSINPAKTGGSNHNKWWIAILRWSHARNDYGLWSTVALIAILPAFILAMGGVKEGPWEKAARIFAGIGFTILFMLMLLSFLDDIWTRFNKDKSGER